MAGMWPNLPEASSSAATTDAGHTHPADNNRYTLVLLTADFTGAAAAKGGR